MADLPTLQDRIIERYAAAGAPWGHTTIAAALYCFDLGMLRPTRPGHFDQELGRTVYLDEGLQKSAH